MIRESVVEAMAQAMYLLDWPDGWVENAEAGIINQYVWRDQAEVALDAALDLIDQEQLVQDVRSFVAALRAGKGSDDV